MTMISCDNCAAQMTEDQVRPATDLQQRIGPGPVVLLPIGECPGCGALVYDPDAASAYELQLQKLRFVDQLLSRWAFNLTRQDQPPAADLVAWIDGQLWEIHWVITGEKEEHATAG